jgi:hypothetical protein
MIESATQDRLPTVGVELVQKPRVLDEPPKTTGLEPQSNGHAQGTSEDQRSSLARFVTPPIFPPSPNGHASFEPLQEWEGVVDWVKGRAFGATLTDLTSPGEAEEEAEFSFDEIVSLGDEPFIKPGAVFYWTIGRARNRWGQRTNISLVRFRRLPAWTARELSEAQERAEAVSKKLGLL